MPIEVPYPELDDINTEFLRALRADPEPATNSALFWHEALEFDRNPEAPRVRSRGDAFLMYLDVHASRKEVPGQKFESAKLPMKVCAAVMTRHAPSLSGPRLINFRYDRTDGWWDGGCNIETQQQYMDLVEGRKVFDERLTEALRKHFGPGIVGVKLEYGLRRWTHPGPMLGLDRGEVRDFVDMDAEVANVWQELVEYLKSCGVKYIYQATFNLEKPKSRLREGQNAWMRYSR